MALIKLSSFNYTQRRVSRFLEVLRTHPSVNRRLVFINKAMWGDINAAKYRRPIFRAGPVSVLVLVALAWLFFANRAVIFPPGDIHYETGRQYALEGMVDEAIMEFKEAERADPQSEHVHFALGILYAKKGIVEEAVKELEKTLQINPKNADARKRLRQILDR